MKPHKWAKEIKAWADGAEIEYKSTIDNVWVKYESPNWSQNGEFRIKPQPKEPQYLYVYEVSGGVNFVRFKMEGWNYLGKIKLEQDDAIN